MALNIKNADVETLATEVAQLAHETKTEAIRLSLVERRDRLRGRGAKLGNRQDLRAYLALHIWPFIPADKMGRVLSREQEDDILGYGPDGV